MDDPSHTASLRKWQCSVFSLTWISYASYYLTRKNFGIVKSRLHEEMGLSIAMLGLIDFAFLSLYCLGQFVNGFLGDKLGAKRILVIGMLLSGMSAILLGFSNAAMVFLLLFGLNGLFQSTGWPNTVKAMTPWFGRAVRGKVMGLWCTNYQVGGLIATALATYLLVTWGWRTAFWVPGLWVIGIGLLLWFFLVEDPREKGLPLQDEAPQSHEEKLSIRSILRLPGVLPLGFTYLGLKFIRYSLIFWLPFFLHRANGYSEEAAGYLSLTLEVGGIMGALATGWLTDTFFPGRRPLLLIPMILLLASSLFLLHAMEGWNIWAHGFSLALIGFLLFGPDTLVSGACAQDIGGVRYTGSVAGIVDGIGSIGGVLQGLVIPFISEIWGWNGVFYWLIACALFSAGCLCLMIRSSDKPALAESDPLVEENAS